MSLPQSIRIAAELESRRDSLKQLLGDRYEARMDDLCGALRRAAEARGDAPFDLAIEASKKAAAQLDGMAAIQFQVAAVEIAEGRGDG